MIQIDPLIRIPLQDPHDEVSMFEIKAWYWLAFGMILILLELVVPSFTIIWFGCGAIAVSALVWISGTISLSMQIFVWAVASLVFTFMWFRIIKPRMFDRTNAGIALEAVLGESGLVIRPPGTGTPPGTDQRGIMKFTTPLLGSEQWQFICTDTVATGDRVTIIDVSGNTLVVKKVA